MTRIRPVRDPYCEDCGETMQPDDGKVCARCARLNAEEEAGGGTAAPAD